MVMMLDDFGNTTQVFVQVESYDSARDDYDNALLGTPCMRDLIHLAGAILGKRRSPRSLLVKDKKIVKVIYLLLCDYFAMFCCCIDSTSNVRFTIGRI